MNLVLYMAPLLYCLLFFVMEIYSNMEIIIISYKYKIDEILGKLKQQLRVLLLEIFIILHHFLQPYPQLVWCPATLTNPLHSCIGHNFQPW